MRLLDYLNKVNDLDALTKAPYSLKIVEDNGFYLFKYNMIASDFSLREVQDARGSIFAKSANGQWFYVCRPFDKFFNYGEAFAATIDWASAFCSEKVDGSIMKVWFYNSVWHLSTNGTVDAFTAGVNDSGSKTFGQIFERVLGMSIQDFGDSYLNSDYTYIFELTSPETRVVIPYDDGIYLLAIRNNVTGEYAPWNFTSMPASVSYPKVFNLNSLDDVLKVVLVMSKDEEGIVVADKFGNRVKVKSPEYLAAHHLRGNVALNPEKVIKMLQNASLDDYMAYFNDEQSNEIVNDVLIKLNALKDAAMAEWDALVDAGALDLTRKQFYWEVENSKFMPYFMKKFGNVEFAFEDYINQMHVKKLSKLLGY